MIRTRLAALVLVGAVTLVGCGSSAKSLTSATTGSGGLSLESTGFCARLVAISQQLVSAAAQTASDPSKAKKYLQQVAQALQTLEGSAPSDIKAALTDLVTAANEAAAAMNNPKSPDVQKLRDFGAKLKDDSQKVGVYLAQKCAGVTATTQ